MIEIGETTGALIVYTAAELEGREIEIRPHDGNWSGLHTGVRARHVGSRVLHAGVFGSLPVGHYHLRLRASSGEEAAVRTVTVSGAAVTETRFSPADERPPPGDQPR